MFGLKVPIVSIVMGEGCSGGALAISCANKLLVLENVVLYVASPEACAAILWKSAKASSKQAEKLKITTEELDVNEKQSFLVRRRNLASLEENEKLTLTPFEKHLDIWRQLWQVLERSDLIVMEVDARDPLFYCCPDLEDYAREIDEHKDTLLLINKADLLPLSIREKWARYFNKNNILFLLCAEAVSASLEGKQLKIAWHRQNVQHGKDDETKIYGLDELLARLQDKANNINECSWDKFKQSIEKAPGLEELLPPRGGPNFKYAVEDDKKETDQHVPSSELSSMVKGRKTVREIIIWIEKSVFPVHGFENTLTLVYRTLLNIVSRSFTHLIMVLERYGQVFAKLCPYKDKQVLLLEEVANYWRNNNNYSSRRRSFDKYRRFSSPRPSEITDLEDKVNLKG